MASSTPQKKIHILLLNGPNLNLLGTREPHLYGATTLPTLLTRLTTLCNAKNITLSHLQSNHEGALIDRLHATRISTSGTSTSTSTSTSTQQDPPSEEPHEPRPDFVIINPGGLTHTSVALRDALLAVELPFVEVHVSNVHAREEFRRHSYLSDKARAVVCGMGVYGYEAAVEFVRRTVRRERDGVGEEGEEA